MANDNILTMRSNIHMLINDKSGKSQDVTVNLLDNETGALLEDFFDLLVGWEIKRSFRYQDFVTLLVLEPDRQPSSPESLQTLVTLIKKNIRETDFTGRIGNFRFGILLIKSDLDRAYGVATRIMEHISNYIFPHEKAQSLNFSLGGACFPTNSTSRSSSELFKKAESAFRLGKNKRKSIYFYNLID